MAHKIQAKKGFYKYLKGYSYLLLYYYSALLAIIESWAFKGQFWTVKNQKTQQNCWVMAPIGFPGMSNWWGGDYQI